MSTCSHLVATVQNQHQNKATIVQTHTCTRPKLHLTPRQALSFCTHASRSQWTWGMSHDSSNTMLWFVNHVRSQPASISIRLRQNCSHIELSHLPDTLDSCSQSNSGPASRIHQNYSQMSGRTVPPINLHTLSVVTTEWNQHAAESEHTEKTPLQSRNRCLVNIFFIFRTEIQVSISLIHAFTHSGLTLTLAFNGNGRINLE